MTDPRYPIGKFAYNAPPTPEQRSKLIHEFAQTPAAFRSAVYGLSPQQIETPYREGGWTVRQLAHHVPDSHMNAYIRFKLALTEEEPTIKTYDEKGWAELPDVQATSLEISLALLDSVHARFGTLLLSMSPDDWKRSFRHPDLGLVPLEKSLALYAWHGRHHVAHVTELRKRMNW